MTSQNPVASFSWILSLPTTGASQYQVLNTSPLIFSSTPKGKCYYPCFTEEESKGEECPGRSWIRVCRRAWVQAQVPWVPQNALLAVLSILLFTLSHQDSLRAFQLEWLMLSQPLSCCKLPTHHCQVTLPRAVGPSTRVDGRRCECRHRSRLRHGYGRRHRYNWAEDSRGPETCLIQFVSLDPIKVPGSEQGPRKYWWN